MHTNLFMLLTPYLLISSTPQTNAWIVRIQTYTLFALLSDMLHCQLTIIFELKRIKVVQWA